MAEQEPRWKETELRRDDIKKLLENTKKLAAMYTDVLKIKRTGWENVLKSKIRKAQKEKEQNG